MVKNNAATRLSERRFILEFSFGKTGIINGPPL